MNLSKVQPGGHSQSVGGWRGCMGIWGIYAVKRTSNNSDCLLQQECNMLHHQWQHGDMGYTVKRTIMQ